MIVNESPKREIAGIGSRFSFFKACLGVAITIGYTDVDYACIESGDCLPYFVQPWSSCTREEVETAKQQNRAIVFNNWQYCRRFLSVSPRYDWPYLAWLAAASSYLLHPSASMQARIAYDLSLLGPFGVGIGTVIREARPSIIVSINTFSPFWISFLTFLRFI